ncbi:MAG: hypothetical protein FWC70_09560 [Defluviitaleaceae bacterium]|nr:hypothetical protein [Defluviitaleaceae bacterium]
MIETVPCPTVMYRSASRHLSRLDVADSFGKDDDPQGCRSFAATPAARRAWGCGGEASRDLTEIDLAATHSFSSEVRVSITPHFVTS